jgi:DNA primase
MAWVNFKELREKLNFREVLEHYGVVINAKNHIQHHSKCPLPTHEAVNRSSSFSANLDKGIWRCFGCGAQGNILDLATRMERFDPTKPEDVRRAALHLAERYSIASQKPKAAEKEVRLSNAARPAGATIVNAVLDFTLKGLDPEHPYLLKRGFTRETISQFELGFCSRGLMKDRIAIPLRNAAGQLVGYAGRVIDDTLATPENPKYRFPSSRTHEGKTFEFSKSLFLYNANAVGSPVEDLVIVEGFAATWWLVQNGFPRTVALMSANASSEQIALIVGMVPRRGRLVIFTDGNQAGRFCAESLVKQLSPYRFVRWAALKEGNRPIDCDKNEMLNLLE